MKSDTEVGHGRIEGSSESLKGDGTRDEESAIAQAGLTDPRKNYALKR